MKNIIIAVVMTVSLMFNAIAIHNTLVMDHAQAVAAAQQATMKRHAAFADADCHKKNPKTQAYIDHDDGKKFGWYCVATVYAQVPNYYQSHTDH